jgi:hypothetical protein
MFENLAIPAMDNEPVPTPFGVFGVPRIGWYACRGRDCRGPFPRFNLAKRELARMCQGDTGFVQRWTAAMKMIGESLL